MQTLKAGGIGDPHSPGYVSASQPVSDKVRDLTSTVLEEGVDSKRTLDKMKSIGSKSLNRGLDNVSVLRCAGATLLALAVLVFVLA